MDDSEKRLGLSSTGSKVPFRDGDIETATLPVQNDTEKETPVQPVEFVEGGLRGWLTVVGGSLVMFCTFGVVQSFGVFQDYYTRISLVEHTPSEVSWIGSMQIFCMFAMGLPAGRLFDAGYFHHCVFAGSLLYLFSIFMLSLAEPHHYYQNFLSQGVGMGIGMGLMFLPCLSVTSHYFRARRTLAMGVVIAGSSVGAVLYPIMLNNIFAKASGFAWGVRAVAFLDLGLLVVANLIMKTRYPVRNVAHRQKQSVLLKEILTDVPYMAFVAGSFLVFWGLFVPFFYLQLFANLHKVPTSLTKYTISILNASSIFGRTIPNFVGDKYGALNVMIPSTIISGGLMYAMLGAHSVAGVVVFGLFYGFFSGAFLSIVTPAASRFATKSDLSDIGLRIGVLSFTVSFALLTGNPIAGALLHPSPTAKYTWWRPLVFASVITFAGAACHLYARRAMVQRKGHSRV